MLFTTCPYCGKKISSTAAACPECGRPKKMATKAMETTADKLKHHQIYAAFAAIGGLFILLTFGIVLDSITGFVLGGMVSFLCIVWLMVTGIRTW